MTPINGDLNITRKNAQEILQKDVFKDLTAKELMILAESKSLESMESPYPNHTGYTEVWATLTPEERFDFMENFKVNPKGGIDIVSLNIKNMGILTAKPNGKDIIDGSFVSNDREDLDMGIPGITYFSMEASVREAEQQGKKISNELNPHNFIPIFPGKKEDDKIYNIVKLFDLKTSGYWSTKWEKWESPRSTGYIRIGDHNLYAISWDGEEKTQERLKYNHYDESNRPARIESEFWKDELAPCLAADMD